MSTEKVLFRHEDLHGHGEVYFAWQSGKSSLLATTGSDGTVAIINRQGQIQERIVLQSICSGLAWDSDGDLLVIITSNTSHIIIWDANSFEKQVVDIVLRDPPSCLIWSKKNQLLAVATVRGNLTIYNHQTTRRIPILGKHSKRIICGAWSAENLLALGSEDKTLSLSNQDGDSLRIVQLRDTPNDIHFAEMKTDERVPGENTVSMILGKRTLFLYHLPEPDSPTELGFQQRYGPLIQHKWFGDGYILLGFGLGHVVAISTHPREVGQELWQVKNHRESLSSIAVSKELELVASCGDNSVKIHAMDNLQETVRILTLADQAGLRDAQWSADGQLLCVTTTQGAVCVYITKLNSLFAASPPRIAILSSLAEVTIHTYAIEKSQSTHTTVPLEIEPSFLSVGSYNLACGMNNHIWFYDLGRSINDTPILLCDREYMAEIKEVALNAGYCAVLCGTKVMIHPIESLSAETQEKDSKLFPDDLDGMHETVATAIALSNDFLIIGTDLGHIVNFSLEQWWTVNQYRHEVGIKRIYTDLDGTRIIFVDDHNQGYIFIPATEETIIIPDFPASYTNILWDYTHPFVFIVVEPKICTTYVCVRPTVEGNIIKKFDMTTKLIPDQIPLMLHDGNVCLHGTGGKLTSVVLATHVNKSSPKEQLQLLKELRKYNDAWFTCKTLDDIKEWRDLGNAAISDLEINFAIRVFRYIGDPAIVFALEKIQSMEDINSISGCCAVLLKKNELAKKFFLKSNRKVTALKLCKDLLQWEQALALASSISPETVPLIAREYAQQLESNGEYSGALFYYEKATQCDAEQTGGDTGMKSMDMNKHTSNCKSGIARTSIRCGDYKRGIKLAMELDNRQLYSECADALAVINRKSEAAEFYEKTENWDKAGLLYCDLNQVDKIDKILENVRNLKVHAAHAKSKESEGKYQEAIKGYKNSGDIASVVKVYLEHLSDPHMASEVIIETRSVVGAQLLARFYQGIGDYESAIKFLITCGCVAEAFMLAQKQNALKVYAELLEEYDDAKLSDFLAVAQIFENEKYTLLAGKYYLLAEEFQKSLKCLLKATTLGTDEVIALSLAIKCVSKSKNEKLCSQLIEFLLGETDGTPKDPKYLFRLYMARNQFKEAAKTAVIIANQEQLAGNYRNAHDLLYSMHQELIRNELSISSDMKFSLILLHRYTLVRVHVKLGNHKLAAKLLVEVAKNISQFPSHIVPILTSTVIECHRAGMTKSAFDYAVMLMRAEYRNKIDPKYIKKIEGIVRKAPKGIKEFDDGVGHDMAPCPKCDKNIVNMELNCNHCKTALPICIATGQHIIKANLSACPECYFLAERNELTKVLTITDACPMCSESIQLANLIDVSDFENYYSKKGVFESDVYIQK